jgi:hypothetical protein
MFPCELVPIREIRAPPRLRTDEFSAFEAAENARIPPFRRISWPGEYARLRVTAGPELARLLVRPRSPAPRVGEPLTFGVPLPRGRVADAVHLAVADDRGRPCPSSARVTERWADGSIRWALVDAVADVPAAGTTLRLGVGRPAAHPTPLEVQFDDRTARLASGDFTVLFDLAAPQGLSAVTVGGRSVLAADAFAWRIVDSAGFPCVLRWQSLVADPVSPLAATVVLRGTCTTPAGRRLLATQTRRLFAGRRALAVDVELHNPSRAHHPGGYWDLGDAGSVLLRSAAVTVSRTDGSGALRARLDAQSELALRDLPFDLTQHSSGGEHWNSRVHVTADGTLPFSHRGYVLAAGAARREGLRAAPTVVIGDAPGVALTVTAPRFWEVFPKALRVSADGSVEIAWLPTGTHAHEIQGGERCHFEFAVGFGADPVTAVPFEWLRAPSIVLPDPEAAAAADVVPRLMPAAAAGDLPADALVAAALDGDDSFVAKRERIDEYGWRHFGDLYADHENGGDQSLARVSHYNNQYDAIAGLILHALRSGDVRWWILADDLARHVAHVDIYWTDDDKAAYNGGLFWHTTHYQDAGRSTHRTYPRGEGLPSGGPSNEHCYTTGLLLHHRLTGAPLSAAAVERLARWAIDIDDGALAPWPLPWLSRTRTGYASATGALTYHGPGRGAANVVHALLDGVRLTGRAAYLDKAREIVERVVHPDDHIDALALPDTERRWSYTVMLQALGRYGDEMGERGVAPAADYARAVLRRYAGWMADHEFPYLDKPERLEFPTETWAAQDLRKAEVFDLAALHATSADERARFSERARFFHRTALETLARMPSRVRTRPMVLLLNYGIARAWHERHGTEAPLAPSAVPQWPPRQRFVPQRTLVKRRLAGGAVAAALLLVGLGLLLA